MGAIRTFSSALALTLFLAAIAGCGKAPESLAEQAAAPPQSSPAAGWLRDEPAGRALPLAPPTREEEAEKDEPLPTPERGAPSVAWRNPQTAAAVEAYARAYQALAEDREADQPLGEVDPLSASNAFVDYINRVGAHANALGEAERTARSLMSPEEKKRFRTFQQNLRSESVNSDNEP